MNEKLYRDVVWYILSIAWNILWYIALDMVGDIVQDILEDVTVKAGISYGIITFAEKPTVFDQKDIPETKDII